MLRSLIAAALALAVLTSVAEARQRHAGMAPMCDNRDTMRPCAYQPNFLAGVRSINVTMHRVGAGARRKAVKRPKVRPEEGDPYACFGGGRYQAMSEGKICPGFDSSAVSSFRNSFASFGGSGLVASARAYVGTNPTGWSRVWCGRFIAMVAPSVAAKVRNPNMAKAYLSLPHTSGNVGDLAVMGRHGGGHVGIVSGFDSGGNPIIVSGNAGGGVVREKAYPRGRILAFVSSS